MNSEKLLRAVHLKALFEQYPIIKTVLPDDPKNLYIVNFTGEWLTKKPSVCFILNHGRSRHTIEMIDFVSKNNNAIYNAVIPSVKMKMGVCDNFSSWEGETLDEGMKKHYISDFGVILWHSHKYDSRTDKACIDKLIILLPAELPGRTQRSK